LLDELRALARTYADDTAVRERLAGGLVNTLNHTARDAMISITCGPLRFAACKGRSHCEVTRDRTRGSLGDGQSISCGSVRLVGVGWGRKSATLRVCDPLMRVLIPIYRPLPETKRCR
jgi:hypothetical protein